MAGISKQALHKYNARSASLIGHREQIFEQADSIRADHPMIGCRKMGYMLRCRGLGRDKIEQCLLAGGYRVKHRPNYTRTTHSCKQYHYPNLIEGLELTGINQLVQTDITYYWVRGRFYYLTFILDVYSRRIIGYHTGRTLEAQCNLKAMQMALKTRKGTNVEGLIHHSDRGSQYINKDYLKLLKNHSIKVSMCTEAWQNAYTERINQTIKNEYLKSWKIRNYTELSKAVKTAVTRYNRSRPHDSLHRIAPEVFEKQISLTEKGNRPKLKIYQSPP